MILPQNSVDLKGRWTTSSHFTLDTMPRLSTDMCHFIMKNPSFMCTVSTGKCARLNENGLSWWTYLGRMRRCDFCGGGVLLGAGFEVSKGSCISHHYSLPHGFGSWRESWLLLHAAITDSNLLVSLGESQMDITPVHHSTHSKPLSVSNSALCKEPKGLRTDKSYGQQNQ